MITASIVPAEKRINFLSSITKQYVYFERFIYLTLDKSRRQYTGGYWEYVTLSNGGKFMFPKMDKPLVLFSAKHQTPITLSDRAAGMCMMLVALDKYAGIALFHRDEAETLRLKALYRQLREYAHHHAEAYAINAFLNG